MEKRTPLPDALAASLARLLDAPDAAFWAGVEHLCAQQADLAEAIRAEADSLHAAARAADGTLAKGRHPAAADARAGEPRRTDTSRDAELRAGDEVGHFTILDVIGQGGMGSVYLAEQKAPVRRRVALKVIKLGMDSKAVLARFEAERQALALMDHSHIARVLEAGVSASGRPYFAMEYVRGVPITRYSDEQRLSLDERLALFKQVCSGVQHAHHKGIIHRDLTPNNVLVTVQDGKPSAKIIDFGLARATDHRLTEKTLFTAQGVILGTPEYMSPEQAGLNALDIDMRSDVYTLGVLLYELLTGSLPFAATELRAYGYDAMCKTIREADPPKPSTKITTQRGGGAAAAKLRRTDAGALLKRLRGDLDWIVMKCLEKDRTRRYETVSQLADDVQRHLDQEAVVARAPSLCYRLSKLAGRYRRQLAAAALMLAALVAGLLTATYFWLDARARQRAFDQLALKVRYERLLAAQAGLHPPWPAQIVGIESWLAQADELLARRGDIARTVNELRKQALPPTAAEIETDRRKHPEFARWQRQAQKLAAFERAQAIRDGAQDLALPAPTAAELALSPAQLNELAWQWVDSDDSKRTFGEEARALMLAQLACARAQDAPPAQRAWFGDTLAWAWFANGKDEEALAQSTAVVALSPPEGRAGYEGYLADMRARVAAARGGGWSEKLQTLRAEVAALDGAVATRLTYNFAPTDEAQRFLHETLVELQRGMDALAANQRQAMAARLRWARGVEGWTRAHPKARTTWQEARQSIAAADGVVASELYRGQAITLPEPDVIGLVPIGMNPVTKLWEFYDLRSAWDGKRDPATIEIPRYVSAGEHHGHIEVRDDTGIVFVLLPGGTFTMGAQAADSNGANYDRDASSHETPHKITLHAFFLARHEMTQGQWQRLSDGEVPSLYHPEYVWGGQPGNPSQRFGWMSPVENVDWLQCERCLSQHGMVLPTEAQWEYGCRAGTSTVWWTGSERESLRGAVNIADGTWKKGGSAGPSIDDWPGFEDGFIVHAPVDSLLPNAFGLHHTHGNVWEWCADWWGYYSQPARAGDGLRLVPLGSLQARIFRGGGFSSVARNVRSALRSRQVPSQRSDALGVRPARGLPRDNP